MTQIRLIFNEHLSWTVWCFVDRDIGQRTHHHFSLYRLIHSTNPLYSATPMLDPVYVGDKLEMLVTDIPKSRYQGVNITTVSPSSMLPHILNGTEI